jgi:hypothetical protein
MTKHTPGPLTAEEIVPGAWEVSAQSGTVIVAEVKGKCDTGGGRLTPMLRAENAANAILFSAAPDLLEQLLIARTWLLNSGFGSTGIMLGINAAISKAEPR